MQHMAVATQASTTIEIQEIETQTIVIAITGKRPIILNRLAEKARQELLMPKRKTAADRAGSLKHNPVEEFQASPYIIEDPDALTYLGFPSSAFKGGMMAAALRLPGIRKTEISQLVWVEGDMVPLYGTPELLMSITRSADMNRTPDVRSRAIIREWATTIAVTFVTPIINETSVVNLLAAAGKLSGCGDWRPEKGKGTYGQYELTNADTDERFQHIMATGGREAQEAAMQAAEPYNTETSELLSWFTTESKKRGKVA